MANIFSNPWDEERQRKLRSPFTGVRPYQPSLSPGGAYGQIWDGNTGMGMMPGPSTPPGGPAPLPPNMQTPPSGGQNPDPRYRPMIPGNEHIGPDGRINQPFRGNPDPISPVTGPEFGDIYHGTINPETGRMFPPGGGPGGEMPGTQQPIYGGPGSEGYGPTTTDVVHYINTETGEKRSGPSSGYGGLSNLGPPWQMDDSMHSLVQPIQQPPDTRFDPNPNPPGYITPLPSPPISGIGGPLPPGGGPNRPSRPSNPPDYRLAQPSPGIGRPNLPDMGHIKPVPLQGQGYNRTKSSSPSPSPAWAVNKTKRTF